VEILILTTRKILVNIGVLILTKRGILVNIGVLKEKVFIIN
jgi:hypothetical protein